MKITEVFNVKVIREREVIEQCYDDVLEDVLNDVGYTKEHITKTLKDEGFTYICVNGGVVKSV